MNESPPYPAEIEELQPESQESKESVSVEQSNSIKESQDSKSE